MGWLYRHSLIRLFQIRGLCNLFLLLGIYSMNYYVLWGPICVFLLRGSLSECLSRVLPTASYFVRGIILWCRWHYPRVVGAFILGSDMPFAKFCGLRVYGCDLYRLFKFIEEVTLCKLPQRMRYIQMLNQETANCLPNYLCMTSSQDCQILHVQIWEDF